VGISPDYDVHVAPQLLSDEDGPMLDVLKASQGARILVPKQNALQPDWDLLAMRFDRFRNVA